MVTEILKMFSVEKNGNKPLYIQLRKEIINYINLSQIGDKLPSERAISEAAGVNRETVRNAIKEFIRKGLLKREKSGTVITAKIEDDDNQEIHPLLAGQFSELSRSSIKPVKLSLYETLPNQKKFWNETVNSFNASHENIQVQIDWVNHKISNKNEYLDYIRKEQSDIFLVSNDSYDVFAEENLLYKIPDTFRKKIKRDCLLRDFYKDDNPLNAYSVPLHFSPWIIVWNLELAEQLGIKIPENIENTSVLPSFFNKISGNIPEGRIATGSIWNLLVSMGITENKSPDIEFFKKRFSSLAPFINKYRNIFSITHTKPSHLETLEGFSRGEMLCYIGTLFFVFKYMDGFSFSFRGEWLAPENGYCYRESPSRIGINTKSRNVEDIFHFIDHIFTENAQKRIINNHVNCSYHKKAVGELEKDIKGLDVEKLDDVLTRYIPFLSSTLNIESFLFFGIKDLYYGIMEKKIDISQAAEEAHSRFKELKQ